MFELEQRELEVIYGGVMHFARGVDFTLDILVCLPFQAVRVGERDRRLLQRAQRLFALTRAK